MRIEAQNTKKKHKCINRVQNAKYLSHLETATRFILQQNQKATLFDARSEDSC